MLDQNRKDLPFSEILNYISPGTELVFALEYGKLATQMLFKSPPETPIPILINMASPSMELINERIETIAEQQNLVIVRIDDIDILENPETFTQLSDQLANPCLVVHQVSATTYPNRFHTITGHGSPFNTLEQLLRKNIECGGINIIFMTIEQVEQYQYPLLGKFGSIEDFDPELIVEMIRARRSRPNGCREPILFYANPGKVPKLYPPRATEDTLYASPFHRIIEAHDYSWFGIRTEELKQRLHEIMVNAGYLEEKFTWLILMISLKQMIKVMLLDITIQKCSTI